MNTIHPPSNQALSSVQPATLTRFNQQVIQCQDDAYNLAIYCWALKRALRKSPRRR
jgi:hypothetical protein